MFIFIVVPTKHQNSKLHFEYLEGRLIELVHYIHYM